MHLGACPSETNVMLIHCGSDVGSKWRLLCLLIHSTTEHLNRSIGDILVYICSGGETVVDWWQLTQGGSKVICQSSLCWDAAVNQTMWEGPYCVTSQRQASEIGQYEEGVEILVDKKNDNNKNTLGGVHTLPTHISIQTTWRSARSIRWPL